MSAISDHAATACITMLKLHDHLNHDQLLRGMKDGKQSDVVVMDFAKAFDKVSHTRLLHKRHMYGIDPETCRWTRAQFHKRFCNGFSCANVAR